MANVSVRKAFALPPNALWNIMGDPAGLASWIPSIESVQVDGDIRQVVAEDGSRSRERIVSHDDLNRTYTYEYVDGPLPLARYVSTISVHPAETGSEISWDAEFSVAEDDSFELEKKLTSAIESIYRSGLDQLTQVAGLGTDSIAARELADLFEKVTVMHSNPEWAAVQRDLVAVMGAAHFSDNKGWATFKNFYLSDERGPAWSLLAKTNDLKAVSRAAEGLGWGVGEPTVGAHETRLGLTSPAGLTVVAYSPLSTA